MRMMLKVTIPIAEPFFMGMNASLKIAPVMNAEDLQKGLAEAARASEEVPGR